MAARLTGQALIDRKIAELEELKAREAAKATTVKQTIAQQIEAKEAQLIKLDADKEKKVSALAAAFDARIAKVNAEILKLQEELGIDTVQLKLEMADAVG